MLEGKYVNTLVMGIFHSLVYMQGIRYIVNQDMVSYWGFSLGAALVTAGLAYKRHIKLKERDNENIRTV